MLWITQGDIEAGRVSNQIPADQIKVYSNGNPSGSESKSDVFLLHEGSGYWQDGNFRTMNSVRGNTTSANGPNGDARDTIYVQDDGKGWSANKGPANVNGNINYVDNVSVTINGHTVVQGANSISDVTSSKGGSGWDPNAPGSHTSWHYELSLDASVTGGGEHDQITSITLSSLPKGSIDFNGKTYAVDANGHVTIDVDDTADLNAKITLNTDSQIAPGDIKVDISSEVNNETHNSGEIAAGDTHHSITLSGEDTSTHTVTHDADVQSLSVDEHHELDDNSTDHTARTQSEDNTAPHHVDQSTQSDAASEESDSHDQTHALLIDSEDLYLTPAEPLSDATSPEHTDTLNANTALPSEVSLTNLLGDDALSPDDASATTIKAETAAASHDETSDDNTTSATTLSHEAPLNFSDILHDEGNDHDLGKLLPVADVSAENHNGADHIVAGDSPHDAGDAFTGGDHSLVDDLIAKPDTDS
nr:hypothetical protein [Citrobacter werkmanii]